MVNSILERANNMNITVGQFKVKSKDIQANFFEMENLIKKAITSSYDMIVFGEYALSGYACADAFNDTHFYKELDYYTEKINEYSDQIAIVFGSVKEDKNNHNVCIVICNNKEVNYSYKETLNKREFNEQRYFKARNNKSFQVLQNHIIFTFGDDLNNGADFSQYDFVVIVDSKPVNQSPDLKHLKNLVYANTIGNSNVLKTIFINGGNSLIKTDEETYSFNHPLDNGLITEKGSVFKVEKLEALKHAIKDFSDDNFGPHKKWIVGNSGGLDSAVTIALLSSALGSESVISYNMRSKFNSDKTVNNAEQLANKLGIVNKNGDIDAAVDAYIKTLNNYNYDEIPTLAYENIQARTRGHLLGGFSSLENAIISNNGNKMEIMLGYATLYGDTIGALSSLGDLLKIEVFELAHEINDFYEDEVIPYNLLPIVDKSSFNYSYHFETPPSAELKSDQIDPMKWFYHDYLLELILKHGRVEVLKMYYDNQFKGLELEHWLDFFDLYNPQNFLEDFKWFNRTMEINNFKRLQMPPVLAYSNCVLNVDVIESSLLTPQSHEEKELETLILSKYSK